MNKVLTEESRNMNAWKLLDFHKQQVDKVANEMDQLTRIAAAHKSNMRGGAGESMALVVRDGNSSLSLRLDPDECEKVLQTLSVLRSLKITQAVTMFESIDLSIAESYDTDNL